MWTCQKCERSFKSKNQSHSCTNIDMGELFIGKPDELVLVFDAILQHTADWEPNTIGTAKNSIVFSSQKAWLIVKPMSKVLDLKFYYNEALEQEVLHKVTPWGKKFAHHIRVQQQWELEENKEIFKLLRLGFDYSLL